MSAATATPLADSAAATQSVVIVTLTTSQDTSGQTTPPVVVTEYSTIQYTPTSSRVAASSTRSTAASSSAVPLTGGNSHGLGTGGTIAIAVAVPVVVVALLGILGFWFWKKRKSNRTALAQRKEEQDQYTFHPNEPAFQHNPAAQYGIPAGGAAALATTNTYRGWQPTNVTRQPTTTSTSGTTLVGRGAATTTPYFGRQRSQSDNLETPTLPAIGHMDDLDSVFDSPTHHARGVLSPGNGSPPLDAIATGSPSSEYSQKDQFSARNYNDGIYQQTSPTFVPASQGYSASQAPREKYNRTYIDE